MCENDVMIILNDQKLVLRGYVVSITRVRS